MNRQYFTLVIALLLLPLAGFAQQLPAYGLAVGNIGIRADSSFTTRATEKLPAGQQAQIIGSTVREHEDNAQKQLFKWWKIKTLGGKTGWVYGDGFAVLEQKRHLPTGLRAYHLSKQNFGGSFDDCQLWFAVISGRDLAAGSNFMGSNYLETYLVLTNDNGQSIPIPLSGESQFGKTIVDHLEIVETNGDEVPEILVQKTSQGIERSEASQWVDLYAFQAGTLRKVFGESLSGRAGIFKGSMHLNIGNELIQSSFLKAKASNVWQLHVETYYWNKRIKEFEVLYPAQPGLIAAQPKSAGLAMLDRPQGKILQRLNSSSQVYIQELNTESTSWARVITDKGQVGYLRFDQLLLKNYPQEQWLVNQLNQKVSKGQLYSLQ